MIMRCFSILNLELGKTIHLYINFSGKVKCIFTVEEEFELGDARNVTKYLLSDVDAAIVINRRGTGDIMTSCGGSIAFCDEAYG